MTGGVRRWAGARVALGDQVDSAFEVILGRCCDGPITVTHIDLRLDNLIFARSGSVMAGSGGSIGSSRCEGEAWPTSHT